MPFGRGRRHRHQHRRTRGSFRAKKSKKTERCQRDVEKNMETQVENHKKQWKTAKNDRNRTRRRQLDPKGGLFTLFRPLCHRRGSRWVPRGYFYPMDCYRRIFPTLPATYPCKRYLPVERNIPWEGKDPPQVQLSPPRGWRCTYIPPKCLRG